MPGTYSTEIYIGDDWKRTIVITDPNGDPVVLTGYSARWQVRSEKLAVVPLVSMTTTTGELVIAGAALTASLTAAVTKLLPSGAHYHDLELTSPTGVVTSYLAGKMRIVQDVSR